MLSAVNISWLDSPGNRSRPCNLFQSPRNKPVTKQIAVRYQWWFKASPNKASVVSALLQIPSV